MSDALTQLLAERPYVLADGATGTNLFARGLESGDAPELWNLEHPERVAALHREMIEAGADIVMTNSFGGSSYRLQLHGAQDRVRELNIAAARIARAVADEEAARLGRPILVAGDLGPTGELFEPLGPLTVAEASDAFEEQAAALREGGADISWIETVSSIDELEAAVTGAARVDLPIVCTLTFDTHGRTMMGVTPQAMVQLCRETLTQPLAYGANCGVGPADLVATISAMAAAGADQDILVAKGNCGVPAFVDGAVHYDGTPETMAAYARLSRDAGARIIGGCCGTTAAHLRAIRDALEGYEPAGRPGLAEIVAALGEPSAGAAKLLAGDAAPREAGRPLRRRGARE